MRGGRHHVGTWKVTTFVAGLRASCLMAPMVPDGPMTGEVFRAYVEQVLIPELSPGDVLVLDNLATHKVADVRETIQGAGASLSYLSPYSPDLNPIEQVFAKLKALLRNTAARSNEALWTAIGALLDSFPADECQNYLTNCGYEPVQVEKCSIPHQAVQHLGGARPAGGPVYFLSSPKIRGRTLKD